MVVCLKFLAIIFIVLSLGVRSQTPAPQEQDTVTDIQTLNIGDEITVTQNQDADIKYYKVSITELLTDRDLLVATRGLTPQSDPDVFISYKSTGNKHPRNAQSSDITCRAAGQDLCVVGSEQLKSNNALPFDVYLSVVCYNFPCTFVFAVYYQQEYALDVDKRLIIIYSSDRKSQGEVVKLTVPTEEQLGHELTALMIECQYLNALAEDANFQMTVYEGEDTNAGKGRTQHVGLDIWGAGKGLLLTPPFLKGGQTYKIELQAAANAVLALDAYFVNKEYNISFSNYDTRLLMRYNNSDSYLALYVFDFQHAYVEGSAIKDEDDIALLLNPFQGNPDLYAHCSTNQRPQSLNLYDWNSTRNAREQITISAAERAETCNSNSKLYIAVSSRFVSSFLFYIYAQNHNLQELFLDFPTQGEIQPKTITNFKLTFKTGAYTGKVGDDNLLTLRVQNNDPRIALQVLVRPCNTTVEYCKFTQNDFDIANGVTTTENKDKNQLSDNNLFRTVLGGTEQFTFRHNESYCTQNNAYYGQCVYLIALLSDDSLYTPGAGQESIKESKYYLSASFNGHYAQLREGHAEHGYVQMRSCARYRFVVVDPQKVVIDATFQLTIVSGSAELFMSRDSDALENEEQFIFKNSMDIVTAVYNTIEVQSPEVEKPYYLYVCGFESSTYSLLATLTRKNVNQEDTNSNSANVTRTYVRLTHDIAQEVQLFRLTDRFYFSFHLDTLEDVTLTMTRLEGRFNCYITVKPYPEPSATNAIWNNDWQNRQFQRSVMHISASDPQFPNTTLSFYGVLVPHNGWGAQNNSQTQLYRTRLAFHTNSSQTTVHLNEHLQHHLSANEVQEYRFPINNNTKYTIHLSAPPLVREKVKIYFSTQQYRAFPDESRHDFALNFSQEVLEFDRKFFAEQTQEHQNSQRWLLDRCETDNTQPGAQQSPCYLYFTITSAVEAQYDVQITLQQAAAIQLLEDTPLVIRLSQYQNQTHRFYFTLPTVFNRTQIYLNSAADHLDIFANVAPFKNNSAYDTYPTDPAKADYNCDSTRDFYWSQDMIVIHKNDAAVTKCRSTATKGICVLLITVGISKSQNTYRPQGNFVNKTFTIKAIANELHQLHEGVNTYGSVYEHDYQYFSIYVPKDGLTLTISLTPLGDTDVDLFLSSGYDSRPTQDNFNYSSRTSKADFIVLEPNNVKSGWWVVGVQGFRTSSGQLGYFSIQYSANDQIFYKIDGNTPHDFETTRNDQSAYFQYRDLFARSFTVVLSRSHGSAKLCVKQSNNIQIYDCDVQADWSTENKNPDVLHVSNKDPKFCAECYYIIVVQTQGSKIGGTIVVQVEGEYVQLKSNLIMHNYLFSNETQLYFYYTQKSFILSLQVYSGAISYEVGDLYAENPQQQQYAAGNLSSWTQTKSVERRIEVQNSNSQEDQDDQGYGLNYRSPYLIQIRQQPQYLSNADYTVQIYGIEDYKELQQGVITEIDVLSSNKKTLSFYYEDSEQTSQENSVYISIKLRSLNSSDIFANNTVDQLYSISVHEFKPDVGRCKLETNISYTLLSDYGSVDKDGNLTSNRSSFTRQQLLQLSNLKTGQYCLHIDNKKKVGYQVVILLNPSPINQLRLDDTQLFTAVGHKKQNQIYEIIMTHPGTLLLQATKCQGSIQVTLFKSMDDAKKDVNGDIQSLNFLQDTSDSLKKYPNKQKGINQLFIKVDITELSKYKKAEYLLQTKYIQNDFYSGYDLFQIEDSQLDIDYQYQQNLFKVSIPALTCKEDHQDDCLELTENIRYTAFIGFVNDRVEQMAHCGVNYVESLDQWEKAVVVGDILLSNQQLQSEKVNIDVPIKELNAYSQKNNENEKTTYYVKVFATVFSKTPDSSTFTSKFYYKTQSQAFFIRENTKDGSGVPVFWLIFSILCIVGLAVVLFIVFRKYKKVENQLQYEMTDVRNVAGIRKPEQFHEMQEEVSETDTEKK